MGGREGGKSARVPLSSGMGGEVMVFQPMAILDMSERGMRIETTFAMHVDSLHDFRLTLGELSIIVKGRIAHSQIAEVGAGAIRYRTGVEFVEPSGHAQAAIREFVEACRDVLTGPPPAVIDGRLADD